MQQDAATLILETTSAEQTEKVGAALGRLLGAGDVITLSGELGGGKTCFTRGVVAGAAPGSAEQVASPTFAILNEYPGAVPIHHYDCYRLRGCDDAVELGLEDHLQGNGICLIEWPERIHAILPEDHLEVLFAYTGETNRCLSFVPHGLRASQLVNGLSTLQESLKKILSV